MALERRKFRDNRTLGVWKIMHGIAIFFSNQYHVCLVIKDLLGVDTKFTTITWQNCHISNFVFAPTKQVQNFHLTSFYDSSSHLPLRLLLKVRMRQEQNNFVNWRWNKERQKVKTIWAPWQCYIWDIAARNSLPCPIRQASHRSCSHQRRRCCPLRRKIPPHSL